MKTRIIGLGNTILSDDGVGIYAVREVARRLPACAGAVDIVETEMAGFALLDLMSGWERVILVDSIQFDDLAPGTVVRIDPADLRTSLRLRSVHEIDLPTALGLGRRLGLPMPREIVIIAIQAEDPRTFGETLTPSVAGGMDRVVGLVLEEIGALAPQPA